MNASISQAIENLQLIFEELFWSLYRKDIDFNELKEKLIRNEVMDDDSFSIVIDSIKMVIEAFKSQKDTTKEQDDEFIHNEMGRLVNILVGTHFEMIENQFQ